MTLMKIWLIKNFKPYLKNYLLDAENWIYLLCLSQNFIFSIPKDVRWNFTHYIIMRATNNCY